MARRKWKASHLEEFQWRVVERPLWKWKHDIRMHREMKKIKRKKEMKLLRTEVGASVRGGLRLHQTDHPVLIPRHQGPYNLNLVPKRGQAQPVARERVLA